MENWDKERQKAIWQRVTQPPAGGEDGFALLPEALALANAYRQLSAGVPGAKVLWEEQTDTVACLRGLLRLAGRPVPDPAQQMPGRQDSRQLLAACYRRSLKAMAEYLARSADPQTGAVFRILSDRQARHCARIAALLGKG